MLGKLILLFIFVPLADLFLLMYMSSYTGWQFSVGLVIASGILGAFLAKSSSVAVGRKIRQKMQQGQMSPDLLTDGAMIFFAAGLLLTPGFITDAFGLSLLIPVCRRWYQSQIVKWIKRNFEVRVVGQGPSRDANTVEGEVVPGGTHPNGSDPASSLLGIDEPSKSVQLDERLP